MIMTHIVYSLLTIGMNEYILILDFFYDDLALRDPHLCFKWGPRIIDLASFVCELNMTKLSCVVCLCFFFISHIG